VDQTRPKTANRASQMSPVAQRRRARTRGQTLLEFAIVAPLFFLLVFAIMDFGRLFFVQMALQDAMREAARYAVTGNQMPDPGNGTCYSRAQSIMQAAMNAAAGSGVNVSSITVTSQSGVTGGVSSSGPGNPNDLVTVTFTGNLPLMTPLIGALFPANGYPISVSTTFKNEPAFPSAQSYPTC